MTATVGGQTTHTSTRNYQTMYDAQTEEEFSRLVKLVKHGSDFFCPVSMWEYDFNEYLDGFIKIACEINKDSGVVEIPARSYIRRRLFPIWVAIRPTARKISHLKDGTKFRLVGPGGVDYGRLYVKDDKHFVDHKDPSAVFALTKKNDQMVVIVYEDQITTAQQE